MPGSPTQLGSDADFPVFAPDDAWLVDGFKLGLKNPVTPYAGRPLAGVVRRRSSCGRVRARSVDHSTLLLIPGEVLI